MNFMKPTTQAIGGGPGQGNQCEVDRATKIAAGYMCVAPCVVYPNNGGIAECLHACGHGLYYFDYYFYYDQTHSCADRYANDPMSRCDMDCMYGGQPNQNCNTFADTNCDGTVSRAELGTAITQWISNSISRSQLSIAIQAWT